MNPKLYRPQFLVINGSNCWFDAKLIDRREGRLMGVVRNHLDANRTAKLAGRLLSSVRNITEHVTKLLGARTF
jgi:hypothetical protein